MSEKYVAKEKMIDLFSLNGSAYKEINMSEVKDAFQDMYVCYLMQKEGKMEDSTYYYSHFLDVKIGGKEFAEWKFATSPHEIIQSTVMINAEFGMNKQELFDEVIENLTSFKFVVHYGK